MALLLWRSMMLLVLVTIAFMWIFQIYFMERNYVATDIERTQSQLESALVPKIYKQNFGGYECCPPYQNREHCRQMPG